MSSETLTISAPWGHGRVEQPFCGCAVWRYYDPQTGQFNSVDPLVDATGLAYSYGLDDPVLTTDPSGLCALSIQSPENPTEGFGPPFTWADDTNPQSYWVPRNVGEQELEQDTVVTDSNAIVARASKGTGNFGVGSGSQEIADEAGRRWVGPGYRTTGNGKILISRDGLRQYRSPAYKARLGKTQANFESRPVPKGQWTSNGHLDITE